jgi:hypothetical protein
VDLSRAAWHKSTHSGGGGCVEVAVVEGQVAVRDWKDQRGPVLMFTPAEWTAFIAGVHDGEFDLGRWAAPTGSNEAAGRARPSR